MAPQKETEGDIGCRHDNCNDRGGTHGNMMQAVMEVEILVILVKTE